jgi:ATP-dependent RNA circularization protein (DNA/RNA ligase family)
MNNMFYKFPKTPILIAHKGQNFRDEKLMSEEEVYQFLRHEITVEEKIDGANLGISFDSNGMIQVQNRGQYLLPPYMGQWTPLEKWLLLHENSLLDCLLDQYILFGEWCYARHSIYYDKLPDWFIAFDVFDIKDESFLSVKARNRFVESLDISIVPQIAYGKFSSDELLNMHFISNYGVTFNEGIYLRLDENGKLKQRAKLVRADFTQAIEQHWSQKKLLTNRCKI